MSHKATNWAIQQRGLKPATKLVLWYLCDRHNPDYGCFPSQAQLAEDAEISVSSLNDHLAKLEAAGLIRRQQRINRRTRRVENTRYILGFEDDFAQDPSPEIGDGDTGTDAEHDVPPSPEIGDGNRPEPTPEIGDGNGAFPSPNFPDFRLRNSETNPVKREPVREEEEREGARFSDLVRSALDVADSDSPWWGDAHTEAAIRRWVALGLTEAQILDTARDFARRMPEAPNGPKALDRAMARAATAAARAAEAGQGMAGKAGWCPTAPRIGRRAAPAPSAAEQAAGRDATMRMWADKVAACAFIPPSAITSAMRAQMLAAGLVTEDQLRAAGVR